MASELESLIPSGRMFQCLGATTAKPPSPNMTVRLLGITSALAVFCDRKCFVGVYILYILAIFSDVHSRLNFVCYHSIVH